MQHVSSDFHPKPHLSNSARGLGALSSRPSLATMHTLLLNAKGVPRCFYYILLCRHLGAEGAEGADNGPSTQGLMNPIR